jgi:hypothetical protein
MADVGSLVQCLRGIHQGLASIDILDKYDEKRREVYRTVTDPITMENLQRLLQEGKDALGNDAVLRAMDEASRDPVVAAALWKVRLNDIYSSNTNLKPRLLMDSPLI